MVFSQVYIHGLKFRGVAAWPRGCGVSECWCWNTWLRRRWGPKFGKNDGSCSPCFGEEDTIDQSVQVSVHFCCSSLHVSLRCVLVHFPSLPGPFCLRLRVDPKLFGRAVPVAFMGAPVILSEKLEGGRELEQCVHVVQQILATGENDLCLAILLCACVIGPGRGAYC